MNDPYKAVAADALGALAEGRPLSRATQAKAESERLRAQFKASLAATARTQDALRDSPSFGYTSLADMLADVAAFENSNRGFASDRLHVALQATGAGVQDGASMGFLLPPTFRDQVWSGLFSEPDLLEMCDVYPSPNGESVRLPLTGNASRNVAWLSEGEVYPETPAKTAAIELEPGLLGCTVTCTNKLLRNRGAVDKFVRREVARQLRAEINDQIVAGTAVGKPAGLIGASSTITVTRATGSEVNPADIVGAVSRLHPNAYRSAVWLANQEVVAQYLDLAVSGTAEARTANLVSFHDDGLRIAGFPVIVTESCKALGTSGDLILTSLSAYAAAHSGTDEALSVHVAFNAAESRFRFLVEMAGQPWLSAPISPRNGSSTVSAAIILS